MRALPIIIMVMAIIALSLAACATHPPEPVVRTVEVKVPVGVGCPDKRRAGPVYPITAQALHDAPDIFTLAQLYAADHVLRVEREQENEAQIKSCAPP